MKLTLDGLSVEGIKTALQLLDERVGELLEKDWLRKAASLTKWRVEAAAEVSSKMHTALREAAAEGRGKAAVWCAAEKDHDWQSIVSSQGNYGTRYSAWICQKCGYIRMWGNTEGGQHFDVGFNLATPKHVEAAGRFLHLIETSETK